MRSSRRTGERIPHRRHPRHQHDPIHDQPKHIRIHLQHKPLGDEGAGHQRGAGDQALPRGEQKGPINPSVRLGPQQL